MKLVTLLYLIVPIQGFRTSNLHMKLSESKNNIIKTLKHNNDNVFTKSPDLEIYDEQFTLSVNGTQIINKSKYKSLHKKVQKCKNYISQDTTIDNNFNYMDCKNYIENETTCNFRLRFFPKSMKIKMRSRYFIDLNEKITNHNVLSVYLNEKQINVIDLLNSYFEKNKKNLSFITFLVYTFTRK